MDKSIRDLENKHNEYKKIIEKNDGAKYFDLIAAREKEDPGIHEREYKAAIGIGQGNADGFMSKVTNHLHPDHGDALTAYKDKYGSSRENVEKDHIAKAVKFMGAKRNEKRNTAYENKLFSMSTIATPEDQGFHNKFKDYMTTKHSAVGYTGDADYINNFWDMHQMSRPQPKRVIKDGSISDSTIIT